MDLSSSCAPRTSTIAVLSALAVACGSSPDVEQQSGPSSDAPPTERVSEIAFEAGPNATCKVYSAAGDPSNAMTVYGDDQGIVRVYARKARRNAPGSVWSIKCDEQTAKPTALTLDLANPATYRSIEPPAKPINRKIRPALGADRDSIPMAKLLKEGYPPRPNPSEHPDAYARWVERVSRSFSIVAPNIVDAPIHADPQTNTTSTAWGGAILTNGPYFLSDIFLWVPEFPGSPAAHAVIWGGMGGSIPGDDALIQNGISLDSNGSVAQYRAFYEYWHNLGKFVSNFSVRPFDGIEAWGFPTDADLNWNGVGIYGCFCFSNITQETTAGPVCMRTNSQNPPFTGSTAEFIIEPQGSSIPNFGSFGLEGYAWAGGRYADMSTEPYKMQNLVNKSNKKLVQAARLSGSNTGVFFTWFAGK